MIERALPYGDILHEFVTHDGVLYIGGIVADDTKQNFAGQAEDIFRQLNALLAKGGSDFAHVLQVTIYMTDLGDRPAFNRVWKSHFKAAHLPARATIGVADLGPGVKLEILATASKKAVKNKKPRTKP